jgi:putative hydrolase of the HAD superfamily
MPNATAIFCDIGGVFLSDAWGTQSRRKAAEAFNLDAPDFEAAHATLLDPLETGRITLDDYLDRAVFDRPRSFTKDAFKEFMRAQSQPFPETLGILSCLAQTKKYFLACLNNESREMNQHRIDRFSLRDYFSVFLSSCYLGIRKPDDAIYRMALDIAQRAPRESLLIDDREINVEGARRAGMLTIHYQNPAALRRELENYCVMI